MSGESGGKKVSVGSGLVKGAWRSYSASMVSARCQHGASMASARCQHGVMGWATPATWRPRGFRLSPKHAPNPRMGHGGRVLCERCSSDSKWGLVPHVFAELVGSVWLLLTFRCGCRSRTT